MPFLKRREQEGQNAATLEKSVDPNLPANPELPAQQKVTFIAVFMGLVASIGGFMFGYASGQISGYFLMEDFKLRFAGLQPDGSHDFNAVRQGTITSMLCAGSAIGALVAGQIADSLGRKYAISASALWCCIGTIIEISSDQEWAQFAVGRGVNGIGIGSLSVLVPMYQSESAPAVLRGILVSCYQLFVTFGIWTSNMINYGTEDMQGSASWRIPNGISFLWALILGAGILFLPESPRFAYRQGREEEARNTIARYAGVATDSRDVNVQLTEIRVKLEEERAGADTHWWEIFTGPKMFYRTMIGVILQAGQQLTGANFFFYYGTTIFDGVGLSNSYVAQIILGTVNVVCTFGGLYVAQKCGRRKALIFGAGWIAMCFFIYSFVGHFLLHAEKQTQTAGNVLIVFSCFAIASFASTWGPLVWAVVAEMYPARYRAPCMALATASNWIWNFLISFFTRFITGAIDYLYGLVFAGCCIALMFIVFFFVIESKDRSLEEIDTMYLLGVNPITSANWDGSKVPHSEDNTPGASGRNSSEAERGQSVGRAQSQTVEE